MKIDLEKASSFAAKYYAAPHRYYHNQEHIITMYDIASNLNINLSPVQVLAIAFHDIVYLLGTPHDFNEEQSVEMLHIFSKLFPGAIDDEALWVAEKIILDTIDHLPTIEESKIVLDLDLYGFSLSWEDFTHNTALVRKEHILFSDAEFNVGQESFIRGMLERDRIYHTDKIYDKCEGKAQENLQRYLAIING